MTKKLSDEQAGIATMTAKLLLIEAWGMAIFILNDSGFDLINAMLFYYISVYGYGAFNLLFLILLLMYRPRFWGWLIPPLILLPVSAFPALVLEWTCLLISLFESFKQ